MSDKLLLDLGASLQRQFIISQVKLQNCHGNVPYVLASNGVNDWKFMNEDVSALKDALEI